MKEPKSMQPPAYQSQKILNKTTRYTFTQATAYASVYTQELLMSIGAICITGGNPGTLAPIAGSFRIKRIRVWGCPPALGTGCTVAINWSPSSNTTYVPPLEVSDTSMSTAIPAYIDVRPPKQSLAGFWQSPTSSVQLFKVASPVGGYMDIDTEFIISANDVIPSTYTTSTSVTQGSMYYVPLDGSNNTVTPVNLPKAY